MRPTGLILTTALTCAMSAGAQPEHFRENPDQVLDLSEIMIRDVCVLADKPLHEGGGHGMLFATFEGALMMALHEPNSRDAQPRLFELEDTGATLKVTREIPSIRPASD